MTRFLTAGVVLAFALGGMATADEKALKELAGTYLITGLEVGGMKIPAEFLAKGTEAERTIVVKGDKMIANKGGKEDPVTIKLDGSKKPAHIDVTENKAGGKTETMYGIYKLDGDTLTFCIAVGEGKPEDRPKEFKSSEKVMVMTLTKKK